MCFRPSSLSGAACIVLLFAAAANGAPLFAQQQSDDNAAIRLSGFLSTTLFGQDALFTPGNGQSAGVVAATQDGPAGWWHGADVRNTRLLVGIDIPTASAWQIGGLMEVDFFGGFPSGQAFDREQAYLRMRLAYAEFTRGGTRLRAGQEWAPITHDMPTSVNRLAFPPGWGAAGVIGWRFPGVFLRQRLHDQGSVRVDLHAAAMRGDWIGREAAPERPTAGQATLVPQLQAAFDMGATQDAAVDWSLTAGVHVDRKRSPAADAAAPEPPSGWAVAASGRVAPAPFVLRAGGYTGRAVGHLAAHVSQLEDMAGSGGWAQLGVGLGGDWGVRLFGGIDAPTESDVLALQEGILENRTTTAELRHDVGVWAAALEWQRTRTEWWDATGAGRFVRRGNQVAIGALVRF
jgi:hypothetical protein